MLLGRPERGIFFMTFNVLTSTTSSVLSASLLTKIRVASGDAV